VAAVGLTEAKAKEKGLRVRAVSQPYGGVAAAAFLGQDVEGTCQIVVDEDRKVIVGATFVGPNAGELLHAATIAIVGQVPIQQLWHAVPAFPTLSEIWLRFLQAYGT
jgi:dihydrolipoamide dehydrogenase